MAIKKSFVCDKCHGSIDIDMEENFDYRIIKIKIVSPKEFDEILSQEMDVCIPCADEFFKPKEKRVIKRRTKAEMEALKEKEK